MSRDYEAAVDSESSLANAYGWRQIPNLQPAEVSLLLDKRCGTVHLYRWPKCRQKNGLYYGQHTVAQVNQHCAPESFSSRQLVCLDPWATTGIRHKLMETGAFLLAELRRN